MTPEFAQIHTQILRDPNINELPPESGWNWVRLIVLAKSLKDRGRIGPAAEAAYVLRVTPESIARTVQDLGGRIVERDGELYWRDWTDWQTLTNKERQAEWRETHCDDGEPSVTADNAGKQPVTARNSENDKGKGKRKVREVKQQKRVPDATAPTPPPQSTEQQAVYGALCAWLAVDPSGLSRGTAANVGKLAAIYVKAGETPTQVMADASRWRRDDWRGKQGSAPSVSQAQDWRAKCRAKPTADKPWALTVADDA